VSKCQLPNCTAVIGTLRRSSEQLFCCCDTDGCNATPESVFDPFEEEEPLSPDLTESSEVQSGPHPAILFALTTAALLLLILGTLVYWKLRQEGRKHGKDARDMATESAKKLLDLDTSAHNIISECVVLGNEIGETNSKETT